MEKRDLMNGKILIMLKSIKNCGEKIKGKAGNE
jgi:hypothetical protein